MSIFTIDGFTNPLELNPTTLEDKLRKLDLIARIPESVLSRTKAQDLRNLATGILTKTRATKAELLEELKKATEERRKEIAVANASAISELQSMNVDTEALVNLLASVDPVVVAELTFNAYLSRYAPATISKTITPELRKLIRQTETIDQQQALAFDKRWMELVRPLTAEVNKVESDKVAEVHHALAVVDHEAVIEFAEAFLSDVELYLERKTAEVVKAEKKIVWQGVVYALVIATGRRPCEILSTTSTFDYLAEDKLTFSGQAKTKSRGDIGAYFIPTLVDANKCLAGLRYLEILGKREAIEYSKVNAKYGKPLSSDLRKDLRFTLDTLGIKSLYDCRHFYGSYYNELFMLDNNRPNKSTRALLSRLLGHGAEDIKTGAAYESFRVQLNPSPEQLAEVNSLWYELFAGDEQ